MLVTDAIEATGLPDGDYHLGAVPITVSGGRAETAEGNLAGSTLTMDAAVRNAHEWLSRSPTRWRWPAPPPPP